MSRDWYGRDPFAGYDSWKTREPDYCEPPEFPSKRCSCGAWLREEPDRTEWSDAWVEDYSDREPKGEVRNVRRTSGPWGEDGDPWFVFERRETERTNIHVCRKCGAENRFGDW